jgi:hypothetical protein
MRDGVSGIHQTRHMHHSPVRCVSTLNVMCCGVAVRHVPRPFARKALEVYDTRLLRRPTRAKVYVYVWVWVDSQPTTL